MVHVTPRHVVALENFTEAERFLSKYLHSTYYCRRAPAFYSGWSRISAELTGGTKEQALEMA